MTVFSVIGVILLLWMFISWVEVVSNNLTPGYDYWEWNFFTKMLEWFPNK